MWDQVPEGQMGNMLKRSLQSSILNFLSLVIVKYMSIVYVGIASNAAPIITILMSYLMTGERLK